MNPPTLIYPNSFNEERTEPFKGTALPPTPAQTLGEFVVELAVELRPTGEFAGSLCFCPHGSRILQGP